MSFFLPLSKVSTFPEHFGGVTQNLFDARIQIPVPCTIVVQP